MKKKYEVLVSYQTTKQITVAIETADPEQVNSLAHEAASQRNDWSEGDDPVQMQYEIVQEEEVMVDEAHKATMLTLLAEVKKHALAHYSEGWDVVVETMSDAEILDELNESGKQTLEEVVVYFETASDKHAGAVYCWKIQCSEHRAVAGYHY